MLTVNHYYDMVKFIPERRGMMDRTNMRYQDDRI